MSTRHGMEMPTDTHRDAGRAPPALGMGWWCSTGGYGRWPSEGRTWTSAASRKSCWRFSWRSGPVTPCSLLFRRPLFPAFPHQVRLSDGNKAPDGHEPSRCLLAGRATVPTRREDPRGHGPPGRRRHRASSPRGAESPPNADRRRSVIPRASLHRTPLRTAKRPGTPPARAPTPRRRTPTDGTPTSTAPRSAPHAHAATPRSAQPRFGRAAGSILRRGPARPPGPPPLPATPGPPPPYLGVQLGGGHGAGRGRAAAGGRAGGGGRMLRRRRGAPCCCYLAGCGAPLCALWERGGRAALPPTGWRAAECGAPREPRPARPGPARPRSRLRRGGRAACPSPALPAARSWAQYRPARKQNAEELWAQSGARSSELRGWEK